MHIFFLHPHIKGLFQLKKTLFKANNPSGYAAYFQKDCVLMSIFPLSTLLFVLELNADCYFQQQYTCKMGILNPFPEQIL